MSQRIDERQIRDDRLVVGDAVFDAVVQSLERPPEERREQVPSGEVVGAGQARRLDEDPVYLGLGRHLPLQRESRDEALRGALVRPTANVTDGELTAVVIGLDRDPPDFAVEFLLLLYVVHGRLSEQYLFVFANTTCIVLSSITSLPMLAGT